MKEQTSDFKDIWCACAKMLFCIQLCRAAAFCC